MNIDIVKLKAALDRSLDHLITTRGITGVELGSDYYWEVPEADRYNVVDRPGELEIGRLSDDWQFVAELANSDTVPVAYQLTEIAPLLRRVGEVLGRDLAAKGG